MQRVLIISFLVLILFGCQSNKKFQVSHFQPVKVNPLSVENQRKFDYFFYEANKEKFIGNIEKSVSYYIECLKIDTTSSVCLYELANIYAASKQPLKAIELMQRAVRLNSLNNWYLITLGDLYHQTNNFEAAIGIYERLSRLDPTNDDYLFTLAQLYAQNRKFDTSLNILNTLESRVGFNETIIFEKMKLYIQMNKESKSYAEVNKLIKKYPTQIQYIGFLADLYTYFKKFDEATVQYNKMLELDSTYESVYYSLASVYFQKSDTISFKSNYLKAISSKYLDIDLKIEKLVPFLITDNPESKVFNDDELTQYFELLVSIHPFDSHAYILYGNFLRDRKKATEAFVQFQNAIALEPSNEQLWQDILFLDIELLNYDQMLIDGKKALDYFPENGMLSLLLASAQMQKNMSFEAVKTINRVLPSIEENSPLKGQLFALLGDALYKNGSADSAFIAYDDALKVNDKNLGVLNNYSYYLSLEKRDLEKAEKMSSRTIELEPGNSTFLDTYAWVLFQKARYFEAKFIIERAIDNGGDKSFEIVEHYGDILFYNDDVQHALIQWNNALKLMQSIESDSIPSGRLEKLKTKISDKKYIE